MLFTTPVDDSWANFWTNFWAYFRANFWANIRPFFGLSIIPKSLLLNSPPELPEEAVADVLVVEGALQQELHEVALEEALVLEGLEAIVYK